jgi:hypothetical protein
MTETRGLWAPETPAEARDKYDAVGPAAQTVTREVARAMEFSREEYEERVTSDTVETGRDAMFASLLRLELGSVEAFDAARAEHPDTDVIREGTEDVDRVAWHYAPAADTIVATTYQDKPDAAAATLRRIAFGRVYRGLLE